MDSLRHRETVAAAAPLGPQRAALGRVLRRSRQAGDVDGGVRVGDGIERVGVVDLGQDDVERRGADGGCHDPESADRDEQIRRTVEQIGRDLEVVADPEDEVVLRLALGQERPDPDEILADRLVALESNRAGLLPGRSPCRRPTPPS
jgi:hypothetical protein